MTGFEPRTSGIWSDHATIWATQPLPKFRTSLLWTKLTAPRPYQFFPLPSDKRKYLLTFSSVHSASYRSLCAHRRDVSLWKNPPHPILLLMIRYSQRSNIAKTWRKFYLAKNSKREKAIFLYVKVKAIRLHSNEFTISRLDYVGRYWLVVEAKACQFEVLIQYH